MKKIAFIVCLILSFFGGFAQCTFLSPGGGSCLITTSYGLGSSWVVSDPGWISAHLSGGSLSILAYPNTGSTFRTGTVAYSVKNSEGIYQSAVANVYEEGTLTPPPTTIPPPLPCQTFLVSGPTQLEWVSGSVAYTFTASGGSTAAVTFNWAVSGGPITLLSAVGNTLTFHADIAVANQPIVITVAGDNGCSITHDVQVFP